ncbi:hypothetical protein L1987_54799 [Smallanthus sonchifolius]|uniref:Uncharacterized protein n=1 Tax=Smallanthus sonchifolius TaxID=185202 RepID=A0ACB9E972_9ASTR|nr:hypothetical protein L1987_54799 [Smallanthus sonchifolius]
MLTQSTLDHSEIHSPARYNRKSFDSHMKEVPQSPNSVTGLRNKFLHKSKFIIHPDETMNPTQVSGIVSLVPNNSSSVNQLSPSRSHSNGRR